MQDKKGLLPQHNGSSSSEAAHDRKGNISAILSCVMYSSCSIGMVLANKAISMSLDEEIRSKVPSFACVMYQGIVAVVLVEFAKLMNWVEYPAFSWDTAKQWLPVNLIFVSMLSSSFMAMIYLSVPMVTIFKNLGNLITVTGDYFLFGQTVTWMTIGAVLVMTLGAVMSAANDIEFSATGYFWMTVNCICTASYTLYMRFASTNIKLPKFGMVFYNNLLSIGLLLPVSIAMGELPTLMDPNIMTPWFILCNTLAGLLGFYLNFASLWCVSSTSATTYAIIGSLNKVPLTVFGAVLFGTQISNEGAMFIGLGILGGLMYAYAKLAEKGAFGRK